IGETGLRIIEAILKGERDPEALVQLRDRACRKSTVAEMKAALTGHYREEELFVLRQSLEGWKFLQNQLVQCDEQIMRVLVQMPRAKAAQLPVPPKAVPAAAEEKEPKKKKSKRINGGNNALNVDVGAFSQQLQRICGVNLAAVCDLN